MTKRALLQILLERYPEESRKTLYSRVLCGEVFVNGERLRDPKYRILTDASIEFAKEPYVSRGGLKLEYALKHTDFIVKDRVVLDAGSSTGGFTDCLLQHGASHVHAVDVGTNQLAYVLRMDPRVTVHENTNIMSAGPFEPEPEVAVADISFRSLRKAASRILGLTSGKEALVLSKPQFEWPKEDRSFDGVVKDSGSAQKVLFELGKSLIAEGVHTHAVVPSPIAGRKGNREFFLLVRRRKGLDVDDLYAAIEAAVCSFLPYSDSRDSGSPMKGLSGPR